MTTVYSRIYFLYPPVLLENFRVNYAFLEPNQRSRKVVAFKISKIILLGYTVTCTNKLFQTLKILLMVICASTLFHVKFPQFENGVVKLQNGMSVLLTPEEREAVSMFLKAPDALVVEPAAESAAVSDYAQRALDMATSRSIAGTLLPMMESYESTSHVLPTSNLCERLFSVAKHVITDSRSSITPTNLECDILLLNNRDLWDATTIQKIVDNVDMTQEDVESDED